MNALVGGFVAKVNLPTVCTILLTLIKGVALTRLTKLAFETRLVTDIPSNALICAVNSVARKRSATIGVEPCALRSCNIVGVYNGLTAPATERLFNALRTREEWRTVISSEGGAKKQ